MSDQPHGITKKRFCENEENEAKSQKARKRMKIVENDTCQKQQEIKILSKEKKPHFSALTFGEDGQISYDQLHEFLKYAALGKHHNVPQSSWCRLHHQSRLAGVAVVVLDQVDQLHFYRFYLQFKHLRKTFRHRFSLPPISDDVIEHLCGTTASSRQHPRDRRSSLSQHILSPKEMRFHKYPLEGDQDCSHFISTGCRGPATDGSPLFGLDCEMCLTDKGSELTRIALVDPCGRCLMNELVKPELPIRNYLTSYSGITEKLLHPVQTTLAEIQSRLRDLLPSNAVLVGHSLNADLRALEMIHPNVIDTSLLFARRGGRRFSLKFLAEAVLGKEIQREEQMGHDPTEDARCALELAQYFIDQGPRKVEQLKLESRWSEKRETGEAHSLVRAKRENGVQEEPQKPSQSLLEILESVGRKTLLLGEQNKIPSPNCQNQTTSLNKQVLLKALEEIPRSSFSIIRLVLNSKHITSDLCAKLSSKPPVWSHTIRVGDIRTYEMPCWIRLLVHLVQHSVPPVAHWPPKDSHEQNTVWLALLTGSQQMRAKLSDMLTVYAGPFGKDLCLKAAKRTFQTCGHVRSIRIVSETLEPHLCIQYEVLEAAELALEGLNGADVGGSVIKVQRLVTEMTLDGEMLVKELEEDPNNEGVLYLAGLGQHQNEMSLQERWGPWEGLSSVFRPRDPQTGRWRNYCFLRFQTPEGASRVLQTIEDQAARGSKLRSRKALTPFTLFQWACLANENSRGLSEQHGAAHLPPFDAEQSLKKAIKTLDHRIKTLYDNVPEHMLCVVLLPGTNRLSNSPPGLGLMGIKEGGNPPASCDSAAL